LYVYQDDAGESVTKPCAEVLFTEETVDMLLGRGLMPLISFKNQDQIRLARFQSLTSPPVTLMGRWNSA
jgi:type VI secretion system protein ImpC